MQAALTLSQRGYEVELYAKEGLDGKFSAVATPPEKDSFLIFKNYLIGQIKKYPIHIIDKEVTSVSDIADGVKDVILATGSVQSIPPIKGIEEYPVLLAENVLHDKMNLTGPVVVIGGGLVGTETCKYLGNQGLDVTLVEMKDSIADGIGATFVGHMFEKLNAYHVKIMTSATVDEITQDSVVVNGKDIPCAHVVIATGYKPVNDLEEKLSSQFHVQVIGDAKQPRRILDAIEEAYLAANSI